VSFTSREFGRLDDGTLVREYTLDNGRGLSLSAINLGGIVTAIRTPDRNDRIDNVVLGFARPRDYLESNAHFGTIVGRYANRIAGGRFSIDGNVCQVSLNEGRNSLHGGRRGFGARCWTILPQTDLEDGSVALDLNYVSEDGEEGFPGRLEVGVRYTLTAGNEWRIDYQAETDRPTVVNLSHHDYFNLAGAATALDHRLEIASSRYTQIDEHQIPAGIAEVAGTPFDFRRPTRIVERIRQGIVQLTHARGYDHNWILDRNGGDGLCFAARLEDESSGRVMEIETTEPALQFYSGNFLDGSLIGASGQAFRQGDGLCLETQHYPDSPNRLEFPSTELRPGQRFSSCTVHRFGVR
jgi:aldose 1-epimerase